MWWEIQGGGGRNKSGIKNTDRMVGSLREYCCSCNGGDDNGVV